MSDVRTILTLNVDLDLVDDDIIKAYSALLDQPASLALAAYQLGRHHQID